MPVNVKFPFQFCMLLVASVTRPPLVLLIVVPPPMFKVPVPMAELEELVPEALMFSVPVLSVVPPEYVLLPLRVDARRNP